MWPSPAQSWGIQLEIPPPVCGINGWHREIPILKGENYLREKKKQNSRILSVPEFTDNLVWLVWCLLTSSSNLFSLVQQETVCTSVYLVNIHTSTHIAGQHLSQSRSMVPGQMSQHCNVQKIPANVQYLNMVGHVSASWKRGSMKYCR